MTDQFRETVISWGLQQAKRKIVFCTNFFEVHPVQLLEMSTGLQMKYSFPLSADSGLQPDPQFHKGQN